MKMLLQLEGGGYAAPDFSSLTSILIWLILFIIGLLIITIFLKIALGLIDKAKNTDFGAVFVTSLLVVLIIDFLPWLLGLIGLWYILGLIIAVILAFVIISSRHGISFLTAVLVAIIAFILYIVVMILIGAVIAGIIIAAL